MSGTCWSFPRLRILPCFEGVDPVKPLHAAEWIDSSSDAVTTDINLVCHKEEKLSYATQKHTAGIFVGSCLHAVCYGFHSMVAPEGRKDLMKILYERMPQEVLDDMNVVYDFNCQEGEYMLNRLPEMFAKVRLYIDRFHAMSHKCASVFKLQAFSAFQELVSTGAEVLNKFLQRLHSQTPFMKQETYVTIVEAMVGLRNYMLNKEMERILHLFEEKPM
jgi:Kyakuja-Dileera-Zisupton transposase